MQLLQEAEDSSDYTEMTAQDWKDIEREGLAIVNARKSGSFPMRRIVKRLAAKRDLTEHFVRFAEQAFQHLAKMPKLGPLKMHEGKFAGVGCGA